VDAIKAGRVAINREIMENFKYPVDRVKDTIALDGEEVRFKAENKVYLLTYFYVSFLYFPNWMSL
jgi:16S rRNA U516 pseudouridylate synthase RsuA-like enzyme